MRDDSVESRPGSETSSERERLRAVAQKEEHRRRSWMEGARDCVGSGII